MKKLILLFAAIGLFTVNVSAQQELSAKEQAVIVLNEVNTVISLTEEQKAQLQVLAEDFITKRLNLKVDDRESVEALKRERNQALAKVLSPEQYETLKKNKETLGDALKAKGVAFSQQ